MRVIAGEFRSRKLLSPPDLNTRPTPDRLRETLFNILSPILPGKVFIDAYAGCGSVGIEAISRGASKAIFIERTGENVALLKQNLNSLKITDRAKAIHGSVKTYLGMLKADIVFLDPPYERPNEYETAFAILADEVKPELVIAQHSFKQPVAASYGALHRRRQVRQGDNVLSFYAPVTDMQE